MALYEVRINGEYKGVYDLEFPESGGTPPKINLFKHFCIILMLSVPLGLLGMIIGFVMMLTNNQLAVNPFYYILFMVPVLIYAVFVEIFSISFLRFLSIAEPVLDEKKEQWELLSFIDSGKFFNRFFNNFENDKLLLKKTGAYEAENYTELNKKILVAVFLKLEETLKKIARLSNVIYLITLISLIVEPIVRSDSVGYYFVIYTINALGSLLFIPIIFNGYFHWRKTSGKSFIKYIVNALLLFFISAVISVVFLLIKNVYDINNSFYLCFLSIFSLLLQLDYLFKRKTSDDETKRINFILLVFIEVVIALVGLLVASGLSLAIPQIYNVLLDFDNGLTTDLSLPITMWAIVGAISLLLMVIVGMIIINKPKKNK